MKLSAFEQAVVSGLAGNADLAAMLLSAWGKASVTSVQSTRSLVDMAQLTGTEERATDAFLKRAVELSLIEVAPEGYRPRQSAHAKFERIAFAMSAIAHYQHNVHQDDTTVNIVLTKPPTPSQLEKKLSEVGWRTADIEPTDQAFHSLVSSARSRVIVMTPFFDVKGASWLKDLFSAVEAGVQKILILRTLENRAKDDYPMGYDSIAPWLGESGVKVFNYSLPRAGGIGRETFHAKVVLCDNNAAYLGSSNMNGASLEHSMEMGVSLKGRAAADVATVLDAVMKAAQPWAGVN
jgi:phosphatidylserine/phosphatidylglycerophosphate/cardiolipin synthase-like enzyme